MKRIRRTTREAASMPCLPERFAFLVEIYAVLAPWTTWRPLVDLQIDFVAFVRNTCSTHKQTTSAVQITNQPLWPARQVSTKKAAKK
jgi:hypothetical protein